MYVAVAFGGNAVLRWWCESTQRDKAAFPPNATATCILYLDEQKF